MLAAALDALAKGAPTERLIDEVLAMGAAFTNISGVRFVLVDSASSATVGRHSSTDAREKLPLASLTDDKRISGNGYFSRPEAWIRHTEGRGDGVAWADGDWMRFTVRDKGGRLLAYLDVGGTVDGFLPGREAVEMMGAGTDMISASLQLEQMRQGVDARSDRLVQRTDLLEDVLRIASSIVSEHDADKLAQMVLASVSGLFNFDKVILIVYDEAMGAFRWSAVFGYPDSALREARMRTIPIDIVLEDLRESRRIGRTVYFTPIEEVSTRQFSYYLNPVEAEGRFLKEPRAPREFRSGDILAFALHDSSGRVVGVLYPAFPKDGKLPEKETVETVEVFTSLAEVALETARLVNEKDHALRINAQRAEQLSRIFDLTSDILYVRDMDHLMEDVLKTLAQLLGIKRAVMGIRDEERGVFVIRAVYGYTEDRSEAIRKVEYPIERIEYVIDPKGRPSTKSPIKWRKKVGRTTYYMPTESVKLSDDDMVYYPEPWAVRVPRKGEGFWHELDYTDTFIFDRNGVVAAYIEILKPRDDRVLDPETIEVIEIFASLAGIALENAGMFQRQTESRHSAEFYTDLLSHDIKNFNQAILGYLDLLKVTMNRPEQLAMVSKLSDQVMHVSRLATDVRTMSRLTWGEVSLVRGDLGAVLADCMTSVPQYYLGRRISFKHSVEPGRHVVMADELLKELFVNILTNAVKYDLHEPVEIDVSAENIARDGAELVVVSVADRGQGVPDDMKDKIFERFSRSDTRKKGSGLGLHIVRMLVRRYHGRVWVEDRVKGDHVQGAVFKVELPLAR
jgi:signal transduction histidine kinase